MGKRNNILSSGNDLKWDSSSSRSREPQHRRPTSEPTVLLLSKGPDNGTSFWEKKVLCCEVDQQEDRRQASQICLWDPGIKVDLKGLGELQTWKLIGYSPISLYKLLGLLEAKFSLWRTSCFIKGSGGNIIILWVPETEDSWPRVILKTKVSILHMHNAVSIKYLQVWLINNLL